MLRAGKAQKHHIALLDHIGDGAGDIGAFDEDGYLKIIDRKKELIINSAGKNISPANLEALAKSSPIIGQAVAIGDGRNFISVLLVLDPQVAPAWAKAQGIAAASLAELAELEGLPPSYLEQIAGQLRRAGLVTSRMGVKGGYALARQPAAISMADIVRNLEGSLAPVSCLAEGGGPGECTHADTPCSAHAFWERLQGTITSTLEAVTVADLMKEAQPA